MDNPHLTYMELVMLMKDIDTRSSYFFQLCVASSVVYKFETPEQLKEHLCELVDVASEEIFEATQEMNRMIVRAKRAANARNN